VPVVTGSDRVEVQGLLSWEADVEAHALRARGWTISAIARHIGADRKTVRAYLDGTRTPGVRASAVPDVFATFEAYCAIRLADDPHLWAVTLWEETRDLGYDGGYSTFTRMLRRRRLRPHCEPCHSSRGRDHAIIDHPAGEETQFDWVELPDPPASWHAGGHAHVLVGALAHSGRWRGVLAESEDLPHLVEALHAVVIRLGGLTRRWRFDRMATVYNSHTHQVNATFAGVAKYYQVAVDVCPPRHGNRKGVVEKANHAAAQRWWRTLAEEVSPAQAQVLLDARSTSLDARIRREEGHNRTVGALAEAETLGLRPVPGEIYPAQLEAHGEISPQALVSFRGNRYSVPPGMSGTTVRVCHRLGAPTITIVTTGGAILAEHRRAADGAGGLIRTDAHVRALETAVLAAFDTRGPCQHKTRRPPSTAARAEADRLRGAGPTDPATHVVIDMGAYVTAAAARTPAREETP
jgi:transposase